MSTSKKQIITDLIEQVRKFRMCGPSDHSAEETAVTSGYRYLVIQLKRLAGPILPEEAASRLNAIDVEMNNLYSAFDAKAELDAVLLELFDDAGIPATTNLWVIDRGLTHPTQMETFSRHCC